MNKRSNTIFLILAFLSLVLALGTGCGGSGGGGSPAEPPPEEPSNADDFSDAEDPDGTLPDEPEPRT